ncbi:MAG TPA: glycosyltransferase [Thiobacillaceae bacterium]|nr:glycosyltransferase [Thiobacillaceae bacterium]
MSEREPRLVVLSSLFPSSAQPSAGLFIRERMFRVARELPLTVVSPRPWFPGQGLIRLLRPGYRLMPPRHELQQGIEVYYPRFFALPGILRQFDGLFMGLATLPLMWRLRRSFGFNLIDAHFAYPDGYAAALLGRWFGVPVTLTLRGTEVPHSRDPHLRDRLKEALNRASRVFSVSESLRQLAIGLGMPPAKGRVVGNGVDTERFRPGDRHEARVRCGLADSARVLVSVGALVERKGFHRVLAVLPELLKEQPELHYLIVGGASPEGNLEQALREQVAALGLDRQVHFLGPIAPHELRWPLSAADVFVLATRNEGWANVFLEAMACGLPVVTTNVGGNAEVVCHAGLGEIVPFDDAAALQQALARALAREWDRRAIRACAENNGWESRIAVLVEEFRQLVNAGLEPESELPFAGRETMP